MAVKGTVTMAAQLEGTVQKIHTVVGVSTEDYNDLKNKPVINGVELAGEISLDDLGISYTNGLSVYAVNRAADDAQVLRVNEGTVATYGRKIQIGDIFMTLDQKMFVAYTSVDMDGVRYYDAELFADLSVQDYSTLTNKPSINGVELSGDVSASDLGINAGDGTSFYTVPMEAGDAQTISVFEDTLQTYGNTIGFGDVFLTQDKKLFVATTRLMPAGFIASFFADLA